MNINEKLLFRESTDNHTFWNEDLTDFLMRYGLIENKWETEDFMNSLKSFIYCENFERKQNKAITIIKNILRYHNKTELAKYLANLADFEFGIRILKPEIRDHVVHALLSFLLGIYIGETYLKAKIQYSNLQWKIAGLLHDIAYPPEVLSNLLSIYVKNTNATKSILLREWAKVGFNSPDVSIKLDFVNLFDLQNGFNSFQYIQQKLNEWKLDINVRDVYKEKVEKGEFDHGIISSLTILHLIDLMYQCKNPERRKDFKSSDKSIISSWSQTFFEDDIISACTAIFIHNLENEYFENKKIIYVLSPIAFLLKLSDTLQDWDRPSAKNIDGFPSDSYNIETYEDTLVYTSHPERRDTIKDNIKSCLDDSNILIDIL